MKLSKRTIDAIRLKSKSNGRYYYCEEVDDLLDEIAAAAEEQRAELRRLKQVEQEYSAQLAQLDELEATSAEMDAELKRVKAENSENERRAEATLETTKAELKRLHAVETEYLEKRESIVAAAEENTALQQRLKAAEADHLEKERQADAALEAQKAELSQQLETAKADYLAKIRQANDAIAENHAEFARLQKVETEYLGQKNDIAGILLSAQQISSELVEKERRRVKEELATAEEQKRQLDEEIVALLQKRNDLNHEMEKTLTHFAKRKQQLCAELKHDVSALLSDIPDDAKDIEATEAETDEAPTSRKIAPIRFPSVVGGQDAGNA